MLGIMLLASSALKSILLIVFESPKVIFPSVVTSPLTTKLPLTFVSSKSIVPVPLGDSSKLELLPMF